MWVQLLDEVMNGHMRSDFGGASETQVDEEAADRDSSTAVTARHSF